MCARKEGSIWGGNRSIVRRRAGGAARGRARTFWANVSGLDAAARAWLAVGHAVTGTLIVTILVLIARLAQQAMQEEPFTQSISHLMARAGAVLAIGTVVDVGIVLTENILKHLDEAPPDKSRATVIYEAVTEVSSAVTTSVATTVIVLGVVSGSAEGLTKRISSSAVS